MNIRDNIVNYLYDRDYIFCLYDDYAYFYNYKYMDSFSEKEVAVSMNGRRMTVQGTGLRVVKMTKEELLIKGMITSVKVQVRDE